MIVLHSMGGEVVVWVPCRSRAHWIFLAALRLGTRKHVILANSADSVYHLFLNFPRMSSMRNATQRRNHRERAQPADREKWGLLEKHKVSCFQIVGKLSY